MKKIIALIIFNLFIVTPSITLATPGNLNSSGGHRCYFNCGNYPRFTMHYHLKNANDFGIEYDDSYGTKGTVYPSRGSHNIDQKWSTLSKNIFYEDNPKIDISGRLLLKNKNVNINTLKIDFYALKTFPDPNEFDESITLSSIIVDKNGKFYFSFNPVDKGLSDHDYIIFYKINDGNKTYYQYEKSGSDSKNGSLRLIVDYRKIFFLNTIDEAHFFVLPPHQNENCRISNCVYLKISGNGLENGKVLFNFEIKGAPSSLRKAILTLDTGKTFNLLKSSEVNLDLLYYAGRVERTYNLYLEDDYNKLSNDFKIRLRDQHAKN